MNLCDLQVIGTYGKPTFSNSVLRLEICGPREDHLSVIDVPGIFKNTVHGVTTKDDIVLVRDMVYNYMKNPRSVMLTVVPANVDIATQEIIEIAREIDPKGERTLPIMTKIDLVDQGTQNKVIDMIEDQNTSDQLGWVVVRNLGQQELEDGNVDRDVLEEKWHQTPPWNRVRAENFGINALRKRLQEVHTSHVRRTFPSVSILTRPHDSLNLPNDLCGCRYVRKLPRNSMRPEKLFNRLEPSDRPLNSSAWRS